MQYNPHQQFMTTTKLSIIIPVYNVEKYIEKCLLSCLEQDIPQSDYEIIVVNDGSPDGSLAIAERIAATATNITVVSQENGGLSAARNTGLKIAKGDYIWFIDSDDTIKENCLKSIVEQCFSHDLDLLAICAANIIENKEVRRFSYDNKDIVSGIEVLKSGTMQHCAPFTIYRREFLKEKGLQFLVGIYHEDSEWSPRVYFQAERVGFTNNILYFVTINPLSITRTFNHKKAFDNITVAASIHSFFYNIANKECPRFFHNYISLIINNAFFGFKDKTETKDCYTEEKFKTLIYNNRYLFSHLRSSSVIKYKIEGYLFTIFPKYTLSIYRMLQKINKN